MKILNLAELICHHYDWQLQRNGEIELHTGENEIPSSEGVQRREAGGRGETDIR